ncbi:RIP metalloprotease RseP [Imtechella halotolerans]|uniref:Zinc metalloprotease n=1 Tax=Imtechella halotolerans K1 TaxID=946077 RepID=I0WJ27_9FLAO|nr:RIP metalloprotease RseP [Imtechella halotolerans]EID76393.1 putative zinc metalloprotease [Imtechella halotolerans K1]WMQ63035.1 RIP metalloprotease RseP [Imtechella halotolerans]
MDPFIVKALQLLLSLSILIVLHELGHFIPAKIFKTRVEKFFLFFDVKYALFKKKIGETVYGIGWLPLGGYVKISGMIDESMDKEQMAQPPQPWEFRSKPTWQRLIIMLGGVTVNLILGFLIYMMILFVWGQEKLKPSDMPHGYAVAQEMKIFGFASGDIITHVNGQPLDNALDINRYLMVRDVQEVTIDRNGQTIAISLPDTIGNYMFQKGVMLPFTPRRSTVIDTIHAGFPASNSELRKGDKLISVNGTPIQFFDELAANLPIKSTESVTLEVEREGSAKTIQLSPDSEGKLGINSLNYKDIKITHTSFSLGEAITKGFGFGYWTLHDYVAQFKYIFTKKGASQVGGFGAIGNMFPPAWDWQAFWSTTAFISIILAFMNVLPIPALDGGHVMFLLYEMITGRKPSDKVLEYAQMIGFFLLIGLVLFANGNDIYRWLFK